MKSEFPSATQPSLNPPSPSTDLLPPGGHSVQDTQLTRARASLRQTIARYNTYLRSARTRPAGIIQEALRQDLQRLNVTLNKLENTVVRLAVFGLVSRGKSAVLNALLGRKVLPTGPLNGVTLTPQSVFWTPEPTPGSDLPDHLQIELIDTPGLDEIDGQTRAKMAQEVARQADLILFVVSGDITRTEYTALCDLRRAQKPLLLVFNKIDLYPDQTRQEIYQNLQRLGAATRDASGLQRLLSPQEIVLVAADPAPIQVRVEEADGRVTYQWETPPIVIEPLKQKILRLLGQEGSTLLALNALFQARDAEQSLAAKVVELRSPEAETLIWKFVRYKAIAVALNPIAVLDVIGGTISDLAMIRALSELYGLPVTRHEAQQLWRTILLSSGGLLATELGSGLLLGLGKSGAAVAAGADTSLGLPAYAATASLQGAVAGFGSYSVGRAIQTYLENGCSWGPQGASRVIQDILGQLDSQTIIYRLRQELSQELGLPGV